MALNVSELLKEMLGAAKPVVEKFWKEAKPFAETQFKNLAQNLVMIEKLKLKGVITKEKALIHLDIQKNSFRTVLLTIEGLGILAVEAALNAALGVVKKTVNTAIGWNIL
jgi:hypothetical protein